MRELELAGGSPETDMCCLDKGLLWTFSLPIGEFEASESDLRGSAGTDMDGPLDNGVH